MVCTKFCRHHQQHREVLRGQEGRALFRRYNLPSHVRLRKLRDQLCRQSPRGFLRRIPMIREECDDAAVIVTAPFR